MDDQDAGSQQPAENLISRPPTEADLVSLCRELKQRGAKYIRQMKAITHRAKDAGDLVFLRQWFLEQGEAVE